jgi:hypothetical protein
MKKETINKILFAIMILICFILVIALMRVVSAEWVIPKTTTCDMLNVTGVACDMVWCSVIDCTYNTSVEACACYGENDCDDEVDEAIEEELEDNYYNKSDIMDMLETKIDYHMEYWNDSLLDMLIDDDGNVNMTYLEDELFEFRTQIESKLREDENNPNSDIEFNAWWVVFGLLVAGIFYFLVTKGKQQNPIERGEAPTVVRKIQSTQRMSEEEEQEYQRQLMLRDIADKEKKIKELEEGLKDKKNG